MRHVAQFAEKAKLVQSEELLSKARKFCEEEVEEAITTRGELESVWKRCNDLYRSKPKQEVSNFPYPNAPNIEISISAIAVDAIFANAVDLIFNTSPFITARASVGRKEDEAQALQKFINIMALTQLKADVKAPEIIFDQCKYGNGFAYVPWVKKVVKNEVQQVTSVGPELIPVAPYDIYLPSDANEDLDKARWIGYRVLLSEGELMSRGKANGWDLDKPAKSGHLPSTHQDKKRADHQPQDPVATRDKYEIVDVYAYMDVDDDGEDEDVLIIWDRGSREVLKIQYSPFDRRPFVSMPYQIRGHSPYGMGICEAISSYQDEITQVHNYRLANAYVTSTRVWKVKEGELPNTRRLHPGELIHLSDPVGDLIPEQQGSVGPDLVTAESLSLRLAEQRVGLNDLANAKGTGSRTPGITALTMVGQANKRFAAAFDKVRRGVGEAVKQALWRYQEELLANNDEAERNIVKMVGEEEGALVIQALKDPNFDEGYEIQLTASSATVNKEADRQAAMALFNLVQGYYQRLTEGAMLIANPQIPPGVKVVLERAIVASTNLMEKTLRTFDIVVDPEAFMVTLDDLEEAKNVQEQSALGQGNAGGPNLQALLGGLGQQADDVLAQAGGGGE